jgi:hypothetical protein
MSVRVMAIVWELDLPPMEKLVLLAFADHADDEGHCWPAVARIMRKSGQGERTVRRCIQSLIGKGHLTQDQRSGTSARYTIHPCRSGTPAGVAPLPEWPEPLPERQVTPARAAPKPSLNRKEPSNSKRARSVIPDDWLPRPFGDGTQSRLVVDAWPPGEVDAQLEQFKAHHRSKGNTFLDPQDAWSTWVLNSRKFGASRDARTNALGRHQSADGLSATARAALKVFGPAGTRVDRAVSE